MKVTVLIVGGLLCAASWQANAADADASAAPAAQPAAAVVDAQGPQPGGGAMSGGPASTQNQKRQQSDPNSDAARLQDIFKGGS
ncbi:hypothetical protein [Paraburkholderia sp. GAS42]|uniref:hypothetical protein n=1 Tax=Paraburkholderia sp. GAS42 TaxID=3035135 RepID=UPI003D197DB2